MRSRAHRRAPIGSGCFSRAVGSLLRPFFTPAPRCGKPRPNQHANIENHVPRVFRMLRKASDQGGHTQTQTKHLKSQRNGRRSRPEPEPGAASAPASASASAASASISAVAPARSRSRSRNRNRRRHCLGKIPGRAATTSSGTPMRENTSLAYATAIGENSIRSALEETHDPRAQDAVLTRHLAKRTQSIRYLAKRCPHPSNCAGKLN